MLYYENCSSKVSVCTSGSEKNLHQLLGMNTRLKRGYTVAVFRTPPLAKAKKKKKNTLGFRTELVQKRATSQYSTEGKIHPSLEATGHGTSPTESRLTWVGITVFVTAFVFCRLRRLEYTFSASGVCEGGPYEDSTVITTFSNIAQSTSKAHSV